MKPPRFEYHSPTTTADALALLERHGYDAKILAGGQSLVPLLNFRLARPALLIDVNGVPGLDAIVDDPKSKELSIGALVRQTQAERSPLVARRCALLVGALRHVGHRTIRNRGTIGGSLAHADPSAELPLVLLALGGRVRLASVARERWVAAPDFFVSYLQTALEPNEMLFEARFPWIPEGTTWAFEEFSRRSGDFALAAVCVTLRSKGGVVTGASVAVAGGGPTPVRVKTAEEALAGRAPDERSITEAAALAAAAIQIDDDIHASAEYRRELIGTLVARALRRAASGSG